MYRHNRYFCILGKKKKVLAAITSTIVVIAMSESTQAVGELNATASRVKGVIEEVVVTAQKREENLQDIPIAVSAFDANGIRDARIEEMGDIVARTPNFSFTPYSGVDPQLFIRGIGSSDDGAGGDPSVVVFIDEVAVNRASSSSFEVYDISRIEVLRGPQGTLYGKNAIGGAINFITNKPEDVFSASLSVTPAGDRDRFETRGHLNLPINDKVALRVAGATKKRDGFSKNIITGHDVETMDTRSGRLQLNYLPTDTLDILFNIDHTRDENESGSRKAVPVGTYLPARGFIPTPNPRHVESLYDGELNRKITNSYLRINWDMEWATMTSITGFRTTKFDWVQDLGGMTGIPTAPFTTVNFASEDDKQFTQELRLNGEAFGGDMIWVAGLYFSDEDIDREEPFKKRSGTILSLTAFDQFNNSKSYAAFGQLTYSLTERLNLTLGARYTIDKKDVELAAIDLYHGAPGTAIAVAQEEYDISTDESWSAFTPKATLDFALNDSSMLYATVASGYKSGGYQSAPPNAAAARESFDPEEVISYEMGAKTQWFENRMRLNVSGFLMDYTDLQVLQLIYLVPGDASTSLLVVDNAADATIKGIEMEFLLKPLYALDIGGSYSWLDATFDTYFDANGVDLSGNRLRRSPKNSGGIFLQYTHDFDNGSALMVRTEYNYKGTQFFENDNRPVSFEDSYEVFDASVKYLSADGSWDLNLWGKNLTDELYRTNSISVVDTGFSRLSAPRTWGLSITKRFGN